MPFQDEQQMNNEEIELIYILPWWQAGTIKVTLIVRVIITI